ncbi:MAG: LPS export ABC transporter permease LptG [Candidatus Desulfofervidaceae bacterium]|nr:LPS export ABC transporter permease LptG [Candidatus Desulfofervidaceae bacterium]
MVKIIDKYLGKQFLLTLFFLLISLIFIYLVFDFFEKIDNFSEAHVDSKTICIYFLFTIPGIISQMLPASSLLAILISLSLLKKHNELVALQTCGLSPYRIGLPYILGGIIISLFLFVFNETIVSKTQAITNNIWNVQVERKKPRGGYLQERIWLKGENAIYQIDAVNLKTNTLYGVTVYFLTPSFKLKKRVDAHKAVWNKRGKKWIFHQGSEQTLSKGEIITTFFRKKGFNLKETPSDLRFLEANYQQLNLWQLKKYIKQLKRQGYDTTIYAVDLWQKTAAPLTPFILIIFGVALVFKGKETKIGHTIALGILIAFIFWVIQALSLALGKTGRLHPFLAAWLPHLFFTIWGIVILKYSGE